MCVCVCAYRLTVAYTLERCVAIQSPLMRRSMCTVGRAKKTILGVVMFNAASYLYIPFIVGHSREVSCMWDVLLIDLFIFKGYVCVCV